MRERQKTALCKCETRAFLSISSHA